jgi:hypothetical protein
MSKYTAAEEGAMADLVGTPTETPANTLTEAPTEQATPENTETPVEAAQSTDTPQEPEVPSDTYEKRYKELQRVFTKDREKLKQLDVVAEENAKMRDYINRVNAYLQQQRGQPQPEEDGTELPTVQKVQEMIRNVLNTERQNILTEAERKIAASKIEEYKYNYAKEIGKYAQDLIESEPLLKTLIDGPEDTSLYKAMSDYAQYRLFGPESDPDAVRDIDAFKKEMKNFAVKKTTAMKKLISNHEQAAMARAVKANTPSISSPGGKTPQSGPPSKPPKYGTNEFKDWLTQGLIEETAAQKARK